jgi:hypothetical protein
VLPSVAENIGTQNITKWDWLMFTSNNEEILFYKVK